MATVHALPPEADTMCASCLTKATHFIVVTYSYGRLVPACPKHADTTRYN